jgi:hypothetical protein
MSNNFVEPEVISRIRVYEENAKLRDKVDSLKQDLEFETSAKVLTAKLLEESKQKVAELKKELDFQKEMVKAFAPYQELNKRYREALEIYAEDGNWQSPSKGFAIQYDPEPSLIRKMGNHLIAQKALKEVEG